MAGEWTRRVEPGRTGVIPIRFQSGRVVLESLKIIPVLSNDPVRSNVVLRVKADLWLPVIVQPESVLFSTTTETLAQDQFVVSITNHEPQPLLLAPPVCDNPQFAATLRTNVPGRDYALVLRAVPPLIDARPDAKITLATSTTNEPLLRITVHRQLLPILQVEWPMIPLPPAPLAGPVAYSLVITNRGTNRVELFAPTLPGTNATARLREVVPGKGFYVDLNFPKGYAVPSNQPGALRIRTNHREERVLDVPLQHGTQ
jgi:hypothetical protein